MKREVTVKAVATAAFGLEAVLAREIKALGFENVHTSDGRVELECTLADVVKLNLWLRTAERVFIELGKFRATTFEELFQGVKALPWENWLTEDACFPVLAKNVKSTLMSVPDTQSISKKAIVERLKSVYGLDWFQESGEKVVTQVGILRDEVSVWLDTSGIGLHRRGYRENSGEAPLKETMASALVQLSYYRNGRNLFDPMCGSGTILIEAAQLAMNMAPGLHRAKSYEFACLHWPGETGEELRSVCEGLVKEAEAAILPLREHSIVGIDIDERVIHTARSNAKKAGVGRYIEFINEDMARVRFHNEDYGIVITNPPYGERMGDADLAAKLAQELGNKLRPLKNWSVYAITADEEFEHYYGARADRNRKLYNGRIRCYYYQYYGERPPRPEAEE